MRKQEAHCFRKMMDLENITIYLNGQTPRANQKQEAWLLPIMIILATNLSTDPSQKGRYINTINTDYIEHITKRGDGLGKAVPFLKGSI